MLNPSLGYRGIPLHSQSVKMWKGVSGTIFSNQHLIREVSFQTIYNSDLQVVEIRP